MNYFYENRLTPNDLLSSFSFVSGFSPCAMKSRFTFLFLLFPFLLPQANARSDRNPDGFRNDLSLTTLRDRAFEAQLPYLVYFHDSSKRQAKKMLKSTWADEKVQSLVEGQFLAAVFYPLEDGEQMRLISDFNVYSFPSLLIFSPDGKILGKAEGYLAPETLYAILNKHLSQLQYKQDLMAMSGMASRGAPNYQPVSRGMSNSQMTPPLLVGSMMRFSAQDATATTASIRDLTPIGNLSSLGNSRGQEPEETVEESTEPVPAIVTARSAESGILLDVPGLEAFSLRQLQSRGSAPTEAYGLLVGSYTDYAETTQAVEKFERLWRDRIFVYCDQVNGTLVYRVVLGEYLDEETAKAFSQAIYKMEGINPTVMPLMALLN